MLKCLGATGLSRPSGHLSAIVRFYTEESLTSSKNNRSLRHTWKMIVLSYMLCMQQEMGTSPCAPFPCTSSMKTRSILLKFSILHLFPPSWLCDKDSKHLCVIWSLSDGLLSAFCNCAEAWLLLSGWESDHGSIVLCFACLYGLMILFIVFRYCTCYCEHVSVHMLLYCYWPWAFASAWESADINWYQSINHMS